MRLNPAFGQCSLAKLAMNEESDEQIEEANARFYRALESGSIQLMDELWLHDESARCVHPGWDMISGWERVKKSWERIFESGQKIKVAPTDLQIFRAGEVACVTCKESITIFDEDSFDSALAVATNLFVRNGSDWLIMLHHSSPVPILVPDTATDTIQ
ncbi:MAG: DUF4440 domain-containing protein [Blastocatellia bacterium AA13]|nr:MAG: DUF4440 domain-containing protein [Blastocatellia bacterium AA13]